MWKLIVFFLCLPGLMLALAAEGRQREQLRANG